MELLNLLESPEQTMLIRFLKSLLVKPAIS